MTRKHFLALATLTLLVAAFLRIWQLAIYPPGPHYDEAAELLIARSIAFGGARFFPMVEAYQGREVLFYYLSAPLLALVNDGIFSLRLLSVFCNLLTIAASMALGRAMFRGRRGMIVGLAVGVLMTLSFPMIWLSRQAFRSSALPLMQALALLFLWKGLQAKAQHAAPLLLIIAGLFAGGAVYTYNSSRLFPFWLLLGGVALLVFDRAYWRRRLGQGAIFFGVLAISAAPLAIYAFQRPDVFWGRLSEVTQADNSITLAQSIALHLKMFFIEGDPYLRYNVPGRPYFTLPEGLLLLLGMGIAAYRLTRRGSATERAAYMLALLSPLMVIPSVISVGGLPPSHMRSLGMVPLIFVLVALGAEWCISKIEAGLFARKIVRVGAQYAAPLQLGRHTGLPLPIILIVIVLLVGGVLAGDLYLRWASRADLFYESDADLALAARWLIAQDTDDTPIYFAARDKGHPTVLIEPVPITWLGTDSLFRPAPGSSGLYVFPRSAPPSPEWATWLAPGAVAGLPLGPDGQPAFQAFRLSGDASLPVAAPLFAARNSYLSFAGLSAPSIPAGSDGSISMAWRIDTPPPFADFTPLLMLEDRHGSLIYRGDVYMAGTDAWRSGETLIQRMSVSIPPAMPPGEYVLRVAWIGRESGSYAPYINETGGQGAVWAEIGSLMVTRPLSFPDPSSLPIGVRDTAEIAPGVTLLGWDVPPQTIRPGETLPLTLYWLASGTTRQSITIGALLTNAQGETALWRGAPVDDRYPADQWAAGEVLADRVRWTIPREQAAGDYTLALRSAGKTVDVVAITVAGVPRLFQPPTVETVLNVNFSSQILLYGYHLKRVDGSLSLEIVWKALDTMATDYKVFVHLVSSDGTLLTQRDAMPQSNLYPTSLWLPGEFVVDSYEISALDAGYALRVGLYSPDDGTRLPLLDSLQNVMGDYLQIPLVTEH